MYRVVTIVALLALVCLSTSTAYSADLSGTVTDKKTGEPIPFASVGIEGMNLGCSADSTGYFELRHVPEGKLTLLVSAVGHESKKVSTSVSAEGVSDLKIKLVRAYLDAGTIVVTGTRTPRYIKDVPVFTEVVTRAAIEDKSAHDLFEALDNQSGVRVEQQCQGCNFSILRMQGLGSDHTQLLLDGQPVYSGLASVYGLQQLSTSDVDQIEIVKGAGSALYGSNAVAGAINIITAVPHKTEAKVGVEVGEHGTNHYDVSASARNGKFGIFLFAQQREQDELDETGDVNAPGGVDEPDGWIDRVRANSKNGGFNLFLDDIISTDQLILRGRAVNETRMGGWLTNSQFENPFAPGTERIITDRYTGQLEYHLRLQRGTEVNTSLSVTSHKRDATNDTFLSDYEEAKGEMPPVDLLRPYIADEQLLISNLNIVQPIGGSHRLLLGAQFSHNSLEESGMYLDIDTEEPYSSTSEKSANEVGAYLQDEFKLTEQVEVVAGLRYDYHSSEDEFRGSGNVLSRDLEPLEYSESTLNPRFSIKYSATDDFTLRGSVGSGFRVPYGFSEDLHLCSGSPRVYKGGDLKPEKSLSYSINADYTTSTISASLNLYRTELSNAIGFADADSEVEDLGYTYQWENIDDAFVMGIEFNGSAAVTPELVISARFELFNGEYDNARGDWVGTEFEDISKNISRYPQTSGGVKADYSVSGWNWVVDADYKGKMYIDLTEPADPNDVIIYETESFVTMNAKVSKTILGRYKLYVGAKNITDYTQEVKHIDDAAFMYAPVYGRILYSGVEISL